jgi:histone-lysine N-methyltransferase SETDB1
MLVYALKDKNLYRWQLATLKKIIETSTNSTIFRCKFEKKAGSKKEEKKLVDSDEADETVDLGATCVAYSEPVDEDFILPVKTRIVTLYQNENEKAAPFFSVGTILETPNARNMFRYLVFFDDGIAQYIQRNEAFPTFQPFKIPADAISRDHLEFLNRFFEQYPEKAMTRLHKDNVVKTHFKNKWYKTQVVNVDCSLVRLYFEETDHYEWLYRGSYRLLSFYERFKNEQSEANSHKPEIPSEQKGKILKI